jgi:CHAT domain-containing protein
MRFGKLSIASAWGSNDDPADFKAAHASVFKALARQAAPVSAAEAASLEDVVKSLTHSDVVHLLAHGADSIDRDPLGSALRLGPNDQKPLRAGEMLGLNQICEHVTFQACSLGRQRSTPTNEFWGFTQAALAAGARCVIAPLWNIDLASSTALLKACYSSMDATQTIDRALLNAQRVMHKDPAEAGWSHFYHWGAFRITGIPSPWQFGDRQ